MKEFILLTGATSAIGQKIAEKLEEALKFFIPPGLLNRNGISARNKHFYTPL